MTFFIHLLLGTIMFLGGYRPYFWCQRHTRFASMTIQGGWATIDRHIPLWPSWVWFYTVFYYPVIVLVVSLTGKTDEQFVMISFSYLLTLGAMCASYLTFPVMTPLGWREPITEQSYSARMLRWVRSIDGSNNCFPSGHAAITVMTAYHMSHLTGPLVAFLWALSIHISCLVCKQHYLIDLIAGVALGAMTILVYSRYLVP